MNWIDLLLLLVVGVSVLSGFMAGFARVSVGFAATLVGIFCGFWFYGIAAAHVLDYVSSRGVANLIGFFAIFGGILMLGAIVGHILAKLFKWVGLSWLDRLLGGAFGLARGALIAVALVTVLLAFAPAPPPASVAESKWLPYMAGVSNVLAAMTPREIKEGFRETKDKAQKIWSDNRLKGPAPVRHE